MTKATAAVAIMLLWSSTAYGTIYRWIDAGRVAHYSNDVEGIPLRYRGRVKILYPDSPQAAALLQSAPVTAPAPTPHKPEPPKVAAPAKPSQPLPFYAKRHVSKEMKLFLKSMKSHVKHRKGWKPESDG